MNSSIVSQRRSARGFSAFLMATVSMAVLLPAGAQVASAQERAASVRYAIPAGPLPQALNRFADASGLQLVYDAATTRSLRTGGFSGPGTTADALSGLLAGTGLSYSFTNANTVTITDRVAAAHDGSVAADGSLVLDTISVTGGGGGAFSPDTPYQTAGSSTYVSGEQIERFRGTSPGDMLRGIPGVQTGATHEKGAIDVNVRGMQGMDRVPVIVDGTRQSQTIHEGYSGVASRTYLDPDIIGRVTIEKGPSASPDAVGATGGVARMSTIDAHDVLLDGKNYGIRLKGGFGTNTKSPPAPGTMGGLKLNGTDYWDGNFDRPAFLDPAAFNGSIAAAAHNENFEVLAAYARRKQGNYFAGTRGDTGISPLRHGEEVLSSGFDNATLLLKGKVTLDGGHTLDLSYMNFKSDYAEYPWPGLTSLAGGLFQNVPSRADVDTWKAGYRFDPEDNDLVDFRLNAWMTDTELGQRFRFAYPTAPAVELLRAFDSRSRRYGVDADNTSAFQGWLGDFTLRYGASFSYEDLTQVQHDTGYYLGAPIGVLTYPGRSGNRKEASAFVSSEWRPYDWLKFDAALRYTRAQTVDDCVDAAASLGDGYCFGNMDTDGFAPIAAVTLEPWDGVQFYARYAEAIRPPSLFESTAGGSFMAGSFDLKPEHARNWELGFNFMRDDVVVSGDRTRFKLAYFDNNITDYLTRRPAGQPTFVLYNLDHARFRGLELSAEYDSGRFFGTLGYTRYLSTEFCGDEQTGSGLSYRCNAGGLGSNFVGLHLPPRDSLSITAGLRLLDEKLTVGGRITHSGQRVVESIGSDAAAYAPHTLVDLFASYDVNENFKLDVGVDNLTDRFYISPLSILPKPGPGRTFRLNMTAKF